MSHKLVSLYIGEGEYYTRADTDNVLAEKDKEIEELKEERRWRKVREELPTDEEAVAVCFHTEDGRLITSVDCFFDGEWQMMDDPEGYWMPLPKAAKEEK